MLAWPWTSSPPRSWPRAAWPDDARHYEIYSRPTPSGTDSLLAVIGPGDTRNATITGDAGSTQWIWVRAFNRHGLPDRADAVSELQRVAFDADGNLLSPAPNAPLDLTLIAGAAGEVTARWRYSPAGEPAALSNFHVYVSSIEPFDFTAPSFTVQAGQGRSYRQSLGTFADTTMVTVVVRSVADDGTEELNLTQVSVTADASAPDAPNILMTGVISE